jgi:zinc protease
MKVVVEPSRVLPLVAISIAFHAGAAADPPGKEGLARIALRMLRRGARGRTANEVEDAIDTLGGEVGTDVSYGASWVGGEVILRSLDAYVDLIAGLLAEPAFDEAELGRLIRETQAEIIEARDNDRGLAARALRRVLFADHPYGRRASGTLASVGSIVREDVVAFHRRHMVRANAVVAVSGHIDEAQGQAIAERLLAGLPEGEPTPYDVPPMPATKGRRLVFVDKPQRTQTQLYLGGQGTHPQDEDHIALHVANTVFGGTFTARLMREVRSKRGWSYGASARLPIDRIREAYSVWTAPAAGDAAACLTLELGLLEELRSNGVTTDELTFAQSYLARSQVFDVDTASKRAHQRLESIVLDLPEGYHGRYVEHVRSVTKDQADAAVRRRLSTDDLVIALVGTHADVGAAIEAAIPNLDGVEVVPFDLE